MADPETEELRVEQVRRVAKERAQRRAAEQDDEERQHERRAERAGYLRDKPVERAASEKRIREE